jgi:transposase-like protein
VAKKVARRVPRRKPAAVGKAERRAAQQRARATARAEVARAVKAAVEGALRAEVTELLGREKYERRSLAAWRATPARCSRCGADWSARFVRGGSYPRTLLTVAAAVELLVPRVACICGGTVPLEFAALGRHERCWGDLQERARELVALGLSLAGSRAVLAAESGQPVAASTLSGWVRQAADLAGALREGPLGRVPAAVLLDGIWVTLLAGTGEHFTDRQGRRRERMKRAKAVILVAYGVDPTTGERWVLDWERAPAEDEPSWRRRLERLLARGLRTDAGLEVIVHDGGGGLEAALGTVHLGPGLLRQRCVFHVLRNVRDAVRGEGLDRTGRKERRRAVLADAAAIWRAPDRGAAYERRAAFAATWGEREPEAVATLGRAFAATLAYFEVIARGRERGEAWDARYLRTTSALERLNREVRRQARRAGAFKSADGLAAALALAIARAGRLPDAPPDDPWTEVLEAGLLAG